MKINTYLMIKQAYSWFNPSSYLDCEPQKNSDGTTTYRFNSSVNQLYEDSEGYSRARKTANPIRSTIEITSKVPYDYANSDALAPLSSQANKQFGQQLQTMLKNDPRTYQQFRQNGTTWGGRGIGALGGGALGYGAGSLLANKFKWDPNSWKSRVARWGGAALGALGGGWLGGSMANKYQDWDNYNRLSRVATDLQKPPREKTEQERLADLGIGKVSW